MKANLIISIAASVCILAGCCNTQNKETAIENENPVIDAIMARRSIRQYTDAPVEREKLQKIAECGINAPNAINRQDWEVRIVDSEEYLNGVTDLMKESGMPMFGGNDRNVFRNATAAFFIACPDDPTGMYLQNVGLMSENICLAAYSLGLGTCIMYTPVSFMISNESAKPYLDRLGFSEGYKLRIVIGVGYPDEQPDAKPRDMGKVQFVD